MVGFVRRRDNAAFRLSLVLSGAALALPAMTPAQAQTATTARDATRSYAIPAQPLPGALRQYMQQSGVQVGYPSEIGDDVVAAAVTGTYSPAEALSRLLAGTGLAYRFTGPATATLERAPQAAGDAIRLGPVRVEGSGGGAVLTSDVAATEGSRSYTTGRVATATRLPLSIRETPQTVTVFTRQRMDDQGISEARDIFINTPGIAMTATAPYRESFHARGFLIENYLFDGLAITTSSSRRGTFLSDLAMYDRVEVVRGAAGLVQGTGTPSAGLNFIRKRPTKELFAEIQGEVGRWDSYAAQVDVGGALNQSGSVRLRGVGRYSDSDTFLDAGGARRKLAYLIGEVDVTDTTLLTVSLSYQDNDNATGYGGLPTGKFGADLKFPRATTFFSPWNYWDDASTELYASLQQKLGGDWTLDASMLQIWGSQDQLRSGVSLNDNDEWDVSGGRGKYDNDRAAYDVHIGGPVTLFRRRHDLVLGASLRVARESQVTAGYWPPRYWATNVDIFDWHNNAPAPRRRSWRRISGRPTRKPSTASTEPPTSTLPIRCTSSSARGWTGMTSGTTPCGYPSAPPTRTGGAARSNIMPI